MPGRHLEPFLHDDSVEITAEGFPHSRISPTVYTASMTSDSHMVDLQQSHKRRRVHLSSQGHVNINARFDRMLERANGVALVEPCESSSPLHSRKRGRSTSSLSGSSEKAPSTPVDVYNALEGGRLGDGFMVFEARRRRDSEQKSSSASENSRSRSPLPFWLAETFATLEPNNPLRKLASPSDLHKLADNPTYVEVIGQPIISCSQLEHAQDSVFAFNAPPLLSTFVNTDTPSPLTNIYSSERNHLPCVVDGSQEPESCDPNRDTIQSSSPSEHLTSLLDISPTSRPFGTPGPVFYPKPPVFFSSLSESAAETLATFSIDSQHHPSLYSAYQNPIEVETRRELDTTAGLLDHASPEHNFHYDPLSDNRKPDHITEYTFFEEDILDVDPDRLALHDVAEIRYIPPVDLERPYLESPAEPLDIDVDFRFARALHARLPPEMV